MVNMFSTDRSLLLPLMQRELPEQFYYALEQ